MSINVFLKVQKQKESRGESFKLDIREGHLLVIRFEEGHNYSCVSTRNPPGPSQANKLPVPNLNGLPMSQSYSDLVESTLH